MSMDIARKCIIKDMLTGRSPVSIAAAAIYMACNVSNNLAKLISSNSYLSLLIITSHEQVDIVGTMIEMNLFLSHGQKISFLEHQVCLSKERNIFSPIIICKF